MFSPVTCCPDVLTSTASPGCKSFSNDADAVSSTVLPSINLSVSVPAGAFTCWIVPDSTAAAASGTVDIRHSTASAATRSLLRFENICFSSTNIWLLPASARVSFLGTLLRIAAAHWIRLFMWILVQYLVGEVSVLFLLVRES
jgi:hypothetical protein